jgi:Glutamine synthetase
MTEKKAFKEVRKFLHEAGVKFVRIQFCDNANIIRGKAVHLEMLSRYFEDGVGITAGQQGLPVMYDAVMPDSGLSPVGEIRLIPDWQTLTLLPYCPGHARVMGNMVLNDNPWGYCPRNFLKRMVEAAKNQGVEIKAGFENEFYLIHKTEAGIIPTDSTVFAETLAMDIHSQVINDIADALIAQDILIDKYHPESGPGQQEISLDYTNVLQAADWQIGFRETVKALAYHHHLTASFLPKIFADAAGSGNHIHLSLWHDERNLLPDIQGVCGISSIARKFIGGILHHLPALMAITTPSTNSYRRLQPNCWSGAFRCWGLDNKEAAVRVVSNPRGGISTHFELKTVDGTANPYLTLGAMIAAGLDGVERNLEPGEALTQEPGSLSSEERDTKGIDRLPENLGQAISHLQQDNILLQALNPQLSQAFLGVRQAEWEAMKDWQLDAEVKLLLERY